MEKIVKTQNEAPSARDKQVFLTNFHENIFSVRSKLSELIESSFFILILGHLVN